MGAPRYTDLRQMTDDELIQLYDNQADLTQVGITFALDELSRRQAEHLTRRMYGLTWAMFVLALVSGIACVMSAWIAWKTRPRELSMVGLSSKERSQRLVGGHAVRIEVGPYMSLASASCNW